MAGRLSHFINQQDDSAEIDMMPMLDVVFILLIFFIVSTSFVKETGVEVNSPTASTAAVQEQSSLLIAIRPNSEIWIDQRIVDVRAVRANIERLLVENPNAGVVIQGDKNANLGLTVKVMDQVRLAGVTEISLSANQQ